MPALKIDHIISFSSEDKVHVAKNLLGHSYSSKWKCARPGEKSATVCFQLEKASIITGIDIGNEHSSYIEVLVSRSGEMNDDYKSFLVMSSFMSAIESRESTNINRVRMFKKVDFSKPECDEKWDRIKVVCTQPFNRHVQYGLAFVKFRSDTIEEKDNTPNGEVKLGKFTLRPESPVDLGNGSLFARRKEFEPEKNTKPLTAAAIRDATSSLLNDYNSSPSCSSLLPTCLRNSTSKKKPKNVSLESTPKPRKRIELLNSEEETPNATIKRPLENTPKPRKRIELFNSEGEEKTPNANIKRPVEKKKIEKPRITEDSRNSPQPEKKINNEKESSKRKLQDSGDKTPKKLKPSKRTKSFEKLLEDVVLVISGIQNPDRATLRGKVLEMGAKYKPDWDSSCTHLVCAFMNTPKFNQVKGKGKIVTRQWVEECYTQRKKIPWRRYALDKQEKKNDESEDEIWEKVEEVRSQSPKLQEPMYEDVIEQASDTEDIIEQIQKATPQSSKNMEASTSTKNTVTSASDPSQIYSPIKHISSPIRKNRNNLSKPSTLCFKQESDDDSEIIEEKPKIKEDNNTYSAETDTDEESIGSQKLLKKETFDFFASKVFYIDSNFEDGIIKMLINYIFIHEGSLADDPTDNIDYVICGKEEAQDLSSLNSKAICVLPDWIVDCHKCRNFIPPDEYFVL